MPYRIDLHDPPADALDRVVQLGALDVEAIDGGLAALMPDSVGPATLAGALGVDHIAVSPAVGRDDGSVWILSQRPFRAGRVLIVPADGPASPGALRLKDSAAFGTGLHSTTALCLETLDEMLAEGSLTRVLDVGTGSGVLALAALLGGVQRAVGLDIDPDALRTAADNAGINDLSSRLHLVRGGPEAVRGSWPLVFANVLAAPLTEMAPALVRLVGHGGHLVLSGIQWSMASDLERVYRNLGMRQAGSKTRAGWTALVLQPTW